MNQVCRSLAITILLGVAACQSSTPAAVGGLKKRSCASTLSLDLPKATGHVFVAGDWNGFSNAASPLDALDGGPGKTVFTTSLTLPPGDHAYQFYVDGDAELDPTQSLETYSDGGLYSDLRVADCNAPLITLSSWRVDVSQGRLDAEIQIQGPADGVAIAANGITAQLDDQPVNAQIDLRTSAADQSIVAPGTIDIHATALGTGKHVLRINAVDADGRAAAELYLPLWIEATPFDWRDAFIYFAMVDRFADGDPANDKPLANVEMQANFQGGDFVGLMQKINDGWFDQLGVRAIWITAPNLQPDISGLGTDGRQYAGYHGYWLASPDQTDPRFGTMQELRALGDTAHAHGIRLLLDFVANDIHLEHPWWRSYQNTPFFEPLKLSNGTECICGAGCSYSDPPQLLRCWFTDYLADIDYTDEIAVRMQEEVAVKWMKAAGADGLRVDAVKQFAHVMGRDLRWRLHDEFEQSGVATYMVGETFASSWTSNPNDGQNIVKQFVSDAELNGQFDFPLHWELIGALAQYSEPMTQLETVLTEEQGYYGAAAIMSPFLGNHDVPRYISLANGLGGDQTAWNNPPQAPGNATPYQRLQLGIELLLTLPGAPTLYYGDEFGMPGANDPDNRRMMRFTNFSHDEQATLTIARKLGTLRQSDIVLRRGAYRTLSVDNDLLIFARTMDGQVARIVGINRGSTAQTRAVPIPSSFGIANGAVLTDALGGEPNTAAANQQLTVLVPAMGAVIYAPSH